MEYRLVNGYGEEWDFSHSERMERYITDNIKDNSKTDFSKVIESSGALLLYGETGDYLYELVLEVFSSQARVSKVKELLKTLVKKVKVFDFVLSSRRILLATNNFGADVLSLLMKLIGIVIQAYNLGRLEGVISQKQKVVMADLLDPFETSTLLRLELNRRPKLKKLLEGFDSIYDTDARRLERYLSKRDPYHLAEGLKSLDDKQLVEIANNVLATSFYSYTNNLFNEVDDYFFPSYDLLSSAAWERENTVQATSPVILFYLYFIENCVEPEVLKRRKFYVRDKGVRIVFEKPTNGISFIEVREFHRIEPYEEHILNFFYTVDTGETRMFYLSMSDITASTIPLMFEKDADVVLMVMAWLGLLQDIKLTPGKVFSDIKTNKTFKESSKKNLTMKDAVAVSADMNKWISMAIEAMNPSNYYYETPTQWNYNNESKTVLNKGIVPKSNVIVKVGRYTRRLPEGQKVSTEALELAKKYYIELKEGYTIVDEFERMNRR